MSNSDRAKADGGISYDFSIPALAPKAPPPPIRISFLAVVSFLGIAFFLVSGILLLPLTGFQSDEVMFLNDLWHPQAALSTIGIRHHLLPSMMMSYLGALKSWLYLPIFKILGASTFAVRAPMLLLAAITILMTGKLLRRIQGRTAGVIVVVLLSTDVVFLLTSVFDWGPVVLQNFLLVSCLLCALKWFEDRQDRFAFLTGLAIGLALWNKALFLWNLSGLIIALLLLALPLLIRIWRWKAAALLALGLCLGSYPLLKFNLRTEGSTLKGNAHLSPSGLLDKAWYFSYAIDGRAAASANVDLSNPNPDHAAHPLQSFAIWLPDHLGANPSSGRFFVGLLLIACGLVLAEGSQRKWILFFLISGFIGWLQSAMTPDAGRSLHHTVLFWINWYAALALAMGCIAKWRRTEVSKKLIGAVTAILVAAGALTILVEYGDLIRHSSTTPWTDADVALAANLSALGAQRALTTDWGTGNVIVARSSDKIAVNEEVFNLNGGNFDREEFDGCKAPACWVVTHIPDKLMLPRASQTLQNSFRTENLVPNDEKIISDTHGTPTFLVFAVHSQGPAPQTNTQPLPAAFPSSKPVLLATPNVIVSPGGTGRTTITWQVPANMSVEVHVDRPDGVVFASGKGPGSSQTGFWVKNGMQFFLQDVTNGNSTTVAQVKVEVHPR
jgi:4-amino-4-deoxy-L-arabinose transferase-like glycosyltransferase